VYRTNTDPSHVNTSNIPDPFTVLKKVCSPYSPCLMSRVSLLRFCLDSYNACSTLCDFDSHKVDTYFSHNPARACGQKFRPFPSCHVHALFPFPFSSVTITFKAQRKNSSASSPRNKPKSFSLLLGRTDNSCHAQVIASHTGTNSDD